MDEKTKNGLIIAAFVVLSFVCLVNHLTIAELENDVHVLDVLNTKQGTRMENLEEFVGMESPSMFETDVWDVEFEGAGKRLPIFLVRRRDADPIADGGVAQQ